MQAGTLAAALILLLRQMEAPASVQAMFHVSRLWRFPPKKLNGEQSPYCWNISLLKTWRYLEFPHFQSTFCLSSKCLHDHSCDIEASMPYLLGWWSPGHSHVNIWGHGAIFHLILYYFQRYIILLTSPTISQDSIWNSRLHIGTSVNLLTSWSTVAKFDI